MEDYSIFSAPGKISIFVQKYFCEMGFEEVGFVFEWNILLEQFLYTYWMSSSFIFTLWVEYFLKSLAGNFAALPLQNRI